MRMVRTVLFIVGLLVAGAWLHAQTSSTPPVVISGSDIGFRLEGREGDTPIGRLVVRINGQWVEAQFARSVKPLAK
jgi:hypothetical protein